MPLFTVTTKKKKLLHSKDWSTIVRLYIYSAANRDKWKERCCNADKVGRELKKIPFSYRRNRSTNVHNNNYKDSGGCVCFLTSFKMLKTSWKCCLVNTLFLCKISNLHKEEQEKQLSKVTGWWINYTHVKNFIEILEKHNLANNTNVTIQSSCDSIRFTFLKSFFPQHNEVMCFMVKYVFLFDSYIKLSVFLRAERIQYKLEKLHFLQWWKWWRNLL